LQIEVKRVTKDLRDLNRRRLAAVQLLGQDLRKADVSFENTRSQIQQSLATAQQLEEALQGYDNAAQYLSEVTEQMRDFLMTKAEHDEILNHTPLRLPMNLEPETDCSRSNSEASVLFDD
jgi:uncharacterized membrane protein YheB (UPF0754 family)